MSCSFMPTLGGDVLHIRSAPKITTHLELCNERPHKHYFIEFHYMYEGEESLCFLEEGRELILRAGELAMIPREVYHSAEPCPGKTAKRLCFDLNIDPHKGGENELYQTFCAAKEVLVVRDAAVSGAMNRFLAVFNDPKAALQEDRMGTILLEVVLEVFRRFAPPKKAVQRTDRQRSWQRWIIEEHIGCCYHLPNGLENLAQKLYLSHRQTRKLIHQFYGTGYKELIMRERMEMARLLLRSTRFTLEEIAEKVGYSSYSGFHLAFIKVNGQTPGDYRKSHN